MLAHSAASGLAPGFPKALIVPHAGYVYSGSVAAEAYDRLRPARHRAPRGAARPLPPRAGARARAA